MKITYGLITWNRLEELKTAIRRVSPHVDRTVVIDGGSTDGSLEWLASDFCSRNRVEVFVYPWKDNFIEQRNRYIQHAGEEGWLITTDTDEHLEDAAAYTLRSIAQKAEGEGCSLVRFRAHDIHIHIDGSVQEHRPDYWEPMFFKLGHGVKYTGTLHHSLVRAPGKAINSDLRYFHVKSVPNMWFHGARNYWLSSSMARNTEDRTHSEFREMCRRHGIEYFHDMAKRMREGTVPRECVEWIVRYKDADNAEMRAYFITYFVLMHPELNYGLSNRDFPYESNRKPIQNIGF